jgi:hypothetical protein
MIKQSMRDPSWEATRADLGRLAWVVGLVCLALAGFAALVQRYLGWRLAVGLIGGAALLFTLGLLLVIGCTVGVTSLERWWSARREQRQ